MEEPIKVLPQTALLLRTRPGRPRSWPSPSEGKDGECKKWTTQIDSCHASSSTMMSALRPHKTKTKFREVSILGQRGSN